MLLEIDGVRADYGRVNVLQDFSLNVEKGSLVAMLGPNGAGKTTIANVISGVVRAASGRIRFDGATITQIEPDRRVHLGISLVPQGRQLFPAMSVSENLEMGAYSRWREGNRRVEMAKVFDIFPRLQERLSQLAGTLSGGEQQMLAIGRALMARPRLLVLDEPSLGLAPLLVNEVMQTIKRINRAGVTVLLIEQNAAQALHIAQHAHIIESGMIALSGASADLVGDPNVQRTYFGAEQKA